MTNAINIAGVVTSTKTCSQTISKTTKASRSSSNQPRIARATVKNIQDLTSDIKLITLKIDQGSKVTFSAGQFIGVYDGRENVQPSIFPGTYSIASRPSELPIIRFAVGEDHNPRNLRNFLFYHATIGDHIDLDTQGSGTVAVSPRMVVTPVGGPGGIMLIGGGSAVMGLVSIVEELLHDDQGRQIPAIKLFHSNRSNQDIPFYDRMKYQERNNETFHYLPYVTGDVPVDQESRGTSGRIGLRDLAEEIAGIRLFCICGSGVFCEAMVNMLLKLGVWPGSIRTDYTTRVDPARMLYDLDNQKDSNTISTTDTDTDTTSLTSHNSDQNLMRFEACADATQAKGSMTTSSQYLATYGIDSLLKTVLKKMEDEKPDFPLTFLKEQIHLAQQRLPEVSNIKAADPDFWINYWETDNVTWQAPVVSPWLEKHMDAFVGAEKKKSIVSRFACRNTEHDHHQRHVFVPLCGKSLDMKLLLEAGHHVVGADCSGIACVDFFTENNIPGYVRETVNHPDGKRVVRHRSKNVPIELYEGDIFDLTPEIVGPIDRVLDRAALVALHPSMIADQYLPLMMKLLTPGGKMLLASVSELPFPKAPPHAYKAEQIESVLKPFFSKMRLLETHSYRVNAGTVSEPIYMLTSKLPS